MAMPPTPVPAPAAGAAAMAPGGTDPTAPDAGSDDMDEGGEPPVLFTVLGNPGGPYTLIEGDEDDDGDDAAGAHAPPAAGAPAGGDEDEGQTFDTPQELMKAIMTLLNPSEGAEASFGKGFRGEPDDTASKPDAAPPGM